MDNIELFSIAQPMLIFTGNGKRLPGICHTKEDIIGFGRKN
jgi:hypothetical protein